MTQSVATAAHGSDPPYGLVPGGGAVQVSRQWGQAGGQVAWGSHLFHAEFHEQAGLAVQDKHPEFASHPMGGESKQVGPNMPPVTHVPWQVSIPSHCMETRFQAHWGCTAQLLQLSDSLGVEHTGWMRNLATGGWVAAAVDRANSTRAKT